MLDIEIKISMYDYMQQKIRLRIKIFHLLHLCALEKKIF